MVFGSLRTGLLVEIREHRKCTGTVYHTYRITYRKCVQEVLYAFVHKLCHIKSVEEMRMN